MRGSRRPCDTAEGATVGEVRLTPVGELHALIHEEIPRIPNLGVRFDAEGEPSLYVPGDSLEGEPGDVDVLAFPLAAPWCRSREMTAFLRRFNAPVAVPVHDGILSAGGRPIFLGQARNLGGADTEVRDLAGAGPGGIRDLVSRPAFSEVDRMSARSTDCPVPDPRAIG